MKINKHYAIQIVESLMSTDSNDLNKKRYNSEALSMFKRCTKKAHTAKETDSYEQSREVPAMLKGYPYYT